MIWLPLALPVRACLVHCSRKMSSFIGYKEKEKPSAFVLLQPAATQRFDMLHRSKKGEISFTEMLLSHVYV